MNYTIDLISLGKTRVIASQIALSLAPNFLISLNGELGSGKTTLTREILQKLGIKGIIKSPTFNLVEIYQSQACNIYHFDLYRINSALEWYDLGFDEYFNLPYISFIEWAAKVRTLSLPVDWEINLIIPDFDLNQRRLTISTLSNKGQECLKKLITRVENS